jgi:hypothetical protein
MYILYKKTSNMLMGGSREGGSWSHRRKAVACIRTVGVLQIDVVALAQAG